MLHELVARSGVVSQGAHDGAGYHAGILFSNTSHDRAHVRPLNHHTYTFGIDEGVEETGDLLRHTLLHLQPSGEHIDDAGDF